MKGEDPELQKIFSNEGLLAEAVKTHRRRTSPTKEEEEQQKKRDIFNTYPNAQQKLRETYAEDIKAEVKEHDKKRREAADEGRRMSRLIPIPPPNPRGGMKRKTKRKRSMKKNKKSKKQKGKRRTNKKRSNKKRKTRRRK